VLRALGRQARGLGAGAVLSGRLLRRCLLGSGGLLLRGGLRRSRLAFAFLPRSLGRPGCAFLPSGFLGRRLLRGSRLRRSSSCCCCLLRCRLLSCGLLCRCLLRGRLLGSRLCRRRLPFGIEPRGLGPGGFLAGGFLRGQLLRGSALRRRLPLRLQPGGFEAGRLLPSGLLLGRRCCRLLRRQLAFGFQSRCLHTGRFHPSGFLPSRLLLGLGCSSRRLLRCRALGCGLPLGLQARGLGPRCFLAGDLFAPLGLLLSRNLLLLLLLLRGFPLRCGLALGRLPRRLSPGALLASGFLPCGLLLGRCRRPRSRRLPLGGLAPGGFGLLCCGFAARGLFAGRGLALGLLAFHLQPRDFHARRFALGFLPGRFLLARNGFRALGLQARHLEALRFLALSFLPLLLLQLLGFLLGALAQGPLGGGSLFPLRPLLAVDLRRVARRWHRGLHARGRGRGRCHHGGRRHRGRGW